MNEPSVRQCADRLRILELKARSLLKRFPTQKGGIRVIPVYIYYSTLYHSDSCAVCTVLYSNLQTSQFPPHQVKDQMWPMRHHLTILFYIKCVWYTKFQLNVIQQTMSLKIIKNLIIFKIIQVSECYIETFVKTFD